MVSTPDPIITESVSQWCARVATEYGVHVRAERAMRTEFGGAPAAAWEIRLASPTNVEVPLFRVRLYATPPPDGERARVLAIGDLTPLIDVLDLQPRRE